ncbi:MAG: DUF5692 family protein [Spirochaetales bacterium]|nr:DUF5692 family protein [Spirochaetales bacterium]
MPPFLLLIIVFLGLSGFNELFRRSKWFTIIFLSAATVALSLFVWPTTAGEGTSVNTWFHYVKVYSVVIAALGVTIIRFYPIGEKKAAKAFPAFILALNIVEAVIRDVEIGMVDGGVWHYMNAAAGLISALTISGWLGIYSDKKDKHDMVWPDMTTSWIIAYVLWNFSYIYFCIPEHATFGISTLMSATLPALFIKKGTWGQARAYTLSMWMLFLMTFNGYIDTPGQTIFLPDSPALKMAFGIISLGLNGYVLIGYVRRIIKKENFKLGTPVYS